MERDFYDVSQLSAVFYTLSLYFSLGIEKFFVTVDGLEMSLALTIFWV